MQLTVFFRYNEFHVGSLFIKCSYCFINTGLLWIINYYNILDIIWSIQLFFLSATLDMIMFHVLYMHLANIADVGVPIANPSGCL
jgi:hypothetical protein